jgi:ubiquinone/menaquinone biosynthesis C-methylase UbiE
MRNLFFKIWYWFISTVDKKAEITFMNFGYSHPEMNPVLDEQDEKNRYPAHLYRLTVSDRDIKDKDILEIGCGRGGGLSHLNRYFSPKTVTGIDLNNKAVKFCNAYYKKETNSKFQQADAQKLPFSDNNFDFVINVESSHRYPDPVKFLNEVKRILKPGGYFSFVDFRYDHELDELDNQLNNTGMILIVKQNITQNVVEALSKMSIERTEMVRKFLPKFLHKIGNNFAAVKGTETYNNFKEGKYGYMYYVFEKQA